MVCSLLGSLTDDDDMVFTIRYDLRCRSWAFFSMLWTADSHHCELKYMVMICYLERAYYSCDFSPSWELGLC